MLQVAVPKKKTGNMVHRPVRKVLLSALTVTCTANMNTSPPPGRRGKQASAIPGYCLTA